MAPDGCRLTTQDVEGNVLIWDATPGFLAEQSVSTLPELGERIGRDPADATARRQRAEVLARQGDWDAAASDFAELARLPESGAEAYPAGWWTLAVPGDRPPAFPPAADAVPARWLAPADDPNGFVACPTDGTTAVSRVFAPRRMMAALDIGPVPPGRLWLNAKVIGAAGPGRGSSNCDRAGTSWPCMAVQASVSSAGGISPGQPTTPNAWPSHAPRQGPRPHKARKTPPLDGAAKAELHGLALDWLKANLTAWSTLREPGSSQSRPAIARALSELMHDPDLAGVRDSAALARFPDAERKEWQALWTGFRELLADAVFPADPFAAKPTAAEQVEQFRKEMKERNPGFDDSVTHVIEGGTVRQVSLRAAGVIDISPVSALVGLQRLSCTGGPLSDLSPLKGMKLTALIIGGTQVSDLSPLKGMKLQKLEAQVIPVSDLTPLQGMPLTSLDLHGLHRVTDLKPLTGMPLEYLNLTGFPVKDLSVLEGMTSLQRLVLSQMPISDLTALSSLRLTELCIDGTEVSDLTPLKDMPLSFIRLTPQKITQGLDVLRDMQSLKRIATEGGKVWPAAEFWDRYDKGEFNK